MERPEDFEERQESATETFGDTEPAAGDDATRVDEDRSGQGRFGADQPSETEERRTDG
jgi:hypothetical protein